MALLININESMLSSNQNVKKNHKNELLEIIVAIRKKLHYNYGVNSRLTAISKALLKEVLLPKRSGSSPRRNERS